MAEKGEGCADRGRLMVTSLRLHHCVRHSSTAADAAPLTQIKSAAAPAVKISLSGADRGQNPMSSQAYEHPLHLHQMMMRLGIDPDTDVFPRSALQYAMASRGCGACRSKRTCQDWLDHAPAK